MSEKQEEILNDNNNMLKYLVSYVDNLKKKGFDPSDDGGCPDIKDLKI